jgi:hypothetical protein
VALWSLLGRLKKGVRSKGWCMKMAVFGENAYIWQVSFLPPRMNKVLLPCMQTNIFDSNAFGLPA